MTSRWWWPRGAIGSPVLPAAHIECTYRAAGARPVLAEFFRALADDVAGTVAKTIRGEQVRVGQRVRIELGPYELDAEITSLLPPLSTACDGRTEIKAVYCEGSDDLDGHSVWLALPDAAIQAESAELVGVAKQCAAAVHALVLRLDPSRAAEWSQRHHPWLNDGLLRSLAAHTPFVILAGPPGNGKSRGLRAIAQQLAECMPAKVVFAPLSLEVRGRGLVGELSGRLVQAVDDIVAEARARGAVGVLACDELDALAPVRRQEGLHHEDVAGVDALLQLIDRAAVDPLVILGATNRLDQVDPAVRRRAAAVLEFAYPSVADRCAFFSVRLAGLGVNEDALLRLAQATAPRRPAGSASRSSFSYADLERLVSTVLVEALSRDEPLSATAIETAAAAFPLPGDVLLPYDSMSVSSTEQGAVP